MDLNNENVQNENTNIQVEQNIKPEQPVLINDTYKKTIKRGNVLIIILLIFLMSVSVFSIFIYKKYSTKEDTPNCVDTGGNVNDDINKNDNVKVTVEDAANYGYTTTPEDGGISGINFKVRIPRIIGNTANIKKFNEKILNEILADSYFYPTTFLDSYYMFGGEKALWFSKGAIVDYKYYIQGENLIIQVYSNVPDGGTTYNNATGDGLFNKSYHYNIKEDKEVDIIRVAKELNLALDKVEVTIDEFEINNYDDLAENIDACYELAIQIIDEKPVLVGICGNVI